MRGRQRPDVMRLPLVMLSRQKSDDSICMMNPEGLECRSGVIPTGGRDDLEFLIFGNASHKRVGAFKRTILKITT